MSARHPKRLIAATDSNLSVYWFPNGDRGFKAAYLEWDCGDTLDVTPARVRRLLERVIRANGRVVPLPDYVGGGLYAHVRLVYLPKTDIIRVEDDEGNLYSRLSVRRCRRAFAHARS